jgi:DNA gyrase subunit B
MLSSVEIATIITALGTGIGPGEFDADKARYHRIVIMTDADVDGSHIRTLLLTFFFRQMPALVERGYLYIAQPPLYRIQKGKKENYLKDEGALDEYLLAIGTEKARLVSGDQELGGDSRVVDAAIQQGDLDVETLRDHAAVKALAESIHQKAQKLYPDIEIRDAKIERDEEHGRDKLVFHTTVAGAPRETRLDFDYLSTAEWTDLAALHGALAELGPGPFTLQAGDGTEEVPDVFAAVASLKKVAAQGQTIQRYKGLGEMNPEQLWETTMDPARRTMLQVRVDDAVEANDVFSVLMGDAVEPRREFIEKHALDVQNLDI